MSSAVINNFDPKRMNQTASHTLPSNASVGGKQPAPPAQTSATLSGRSMSQQKAGGPTSFVNKPDRGWLHPDNLIAKDGINYAVRYIGYLEVNTSMKILDFDTRSAIAKESISRVCEENQPTPRQQVEERRNSVDRKICKMLGDRVFLSGNGSNVQLTITSLSLKLSDLDSGATILEHDMPMISFASGGDTDSLNFIAYVAKDKMGGRGCYVLYCGGGLAQDVITTIGQAFELRFKEFLKKSPGSRPPPLPALRQVPPLPDDPEYYNDLPGKVAPPPTTPSNLIDFNTEIQSGKCQYVNTDPENLPAATVPRSGRQRDPFDMSPFDRVPPGGGIPSPASPTSPGAAAIPSPVSPSPAPSAAMKVQLGREPWFHGAISRKDAEVLLLQDGDFLVRESHGSSGQYVLTGMQANKKKHLLLVDPEGIVRTRDRTFSSVTHLIDYHRNNNLPIISAESALRLQRPVVKQR